MPNQVDVARGGFDNGSVAVGSQPNFGRPPVRGSNLALDQTTASGPATSSMRPLGIKTTCEPPPLAGAYRLTLRDRSPNMSDVSCNWLRGTHSVQSKVQNRAPEGSFRPKTVVLSCTGHQMCLSGGTCPCPYPGVAALRDLASGQTQERSF